MREPLEILQRAIPQELCEIRGPGGGGSFGPTGGQIKICFFGIGVAGNESEPPDTVFLPAAA